MALFIGIPFCVFAQEEPRDASKVCRQAAIDFPEEFAVLFRNLGQCVSSAQACNEYGNTPALCWCRQFKILFPQEYQEAYGTQGLGPCVAHYGALP